MLKVVPTKSETRQDFELSLDEIAREGARRLLVQALNLEVEEYIQQNLNEVDESGKRLVVRNGLAKTRTITVDSGSIVSSFFLVGLSTRIFSCKSWDLI